MTTFASANYGRRQFDQSDTTKVQFFNCIVFSFSPESQLIFQHVQAVDIVVLMSRSIYGKVWSLLCHHPATSIVRVGTTSTESHRSILYPNLMQRNVSLQSQKWLVPASGKAPGAARRHKKICICKIGIAWGQILCNQMPLA
ncbi:hypothetical protein T4C_1192 [Trichinella pseudospiralis]|uniref:Uncharacterized protein n=1 Tax=Trichinella pseudospiralis TaxID=6337 RepID=A0A0V1IJR1_TRIPS|nr:hypothetical protein T4C_1192 [Trichinella pseudospiralis]